MKNVTKYLILVLVALGSLWGYLVLYPLLDPYDAKIVLKKSGIYDEPIYLTFNWITEDQIQVGPLITLQIEVRNLPYNKNMTEPNIELFFDEKYLNYWSGDEKVENGILPIVPFKLDPTLEDGVFESKEVNLRFIVPVEIPLEYCDYSLEPPCYPIENILRPAPYDLEERIKSNRIAISVSLAIMSLSATLIWHKIRVQN